MTKMIKLLSAAAAVAMFAGAAQAADMEVAPDAPSWSGAYIGVVGGYGWGDADFSSNVDPDDGSIDVEGFLLGGQLGYDFDLGNGFVLGVVGDMSWSDMDGDTCIEGGIPGVCDGTPDDSYVEADIGWLGTIRARAGFATGSMLIYGTGGLAIADVEATVTNIAGLGDNYSDSNTQIGWVIGAGAEFMITENMTIGAEYLYADLGSEDFEFGASGIEAESDLTVNIVRASLNLRF
ncbi:MAG TPA: outer membrane protein [Aestuariivirga sp.]|nr:outer membrane protein [Aestuariivirga sp.]